MCVSVQGPEDDLTVVPKVLSPFLFKTGSFTGLEFTK